MAPAPVLPATSIYWAGPGVPDSSVDPELTRKEVQQFVDKIATEIGATVPEVTVSVVKGDSAEELVRASRDADLLVVGSRGTGAFAALLLGSVSSKATHHAACPVVVVPVPR